MRGEPSEWAPAGLQSRAMKLELIALTLALLPFAREAAAPETPVLADAAVVRGMTISCQTWGGEWGTDGFGEELEELRELGCNWVAIHPYASIQKDGTVRFRNWLTRDGKNPRHILRPIAEAHERGMSILVKPHIAYWGSGFSWRGDIRFDDPAALARFHETYSQWILALAEIAKDADAFCVGTELEGVTADTATWKKLIAGVRERTDAHLTYAANWSDYSKVGFWSELDAVGLQGYFPISEEENPDRAALEAGWKRVVTELKTLHERTSKPIVFTELGYSRCRTTAREPWKFRREKAEHLPESVELKTRCTSVALEVLDRERDWLRGAFLWKWFVGEARGENFLVDTDEMRAVLSSAWRD